MEANKFSLVFLCVFYLAIFPILRANIAHFDEVWQQRSLEATKAAHEAYKPNPEKVTADFNKHVRR